MWRKSLIVEPIVAFEYFGGYVHVQYWSNPGTIIYEYFLYDLCFIQLSRDPPECGGSILDPIDRLSVDRLTPTDSVGLNL